MKTLNLTVVYSACHLGNGYFYKIYTNGSGKNNHIEQGRIDAEDHETAENELMYIIAGCKDYFNAENINYQILYF
jgi:hypothetical protein